MASITLMPIGRVESDFSDMTTPETMRQALSRLVLRPELADGLDGLGTGDEIVVLFFCDRAGGYRLRRHPRGDTGLPERGVFALRSQYRPNPIGVTVARIVAIEAHIVHVTGLDALDGSPLLDIKPYTPCFDAVASGEPETMGNTSIFGSDSGSASRMEE